MQRRLQRQCMTGCTPYHQFYWYPIANISQFPPHLSLQEGLRRNVRCVWHCNWKLPNGQWDFFQEWRLHGIFAGVSSEHQACSSMIPVAPWIKICGSRFSDNLDSGPTWNQEWDKIFVRDIFVWDIMDFFLCKSIGVTISMVRMSKIAKNNFLLRIGAKTKILICPKILTNLSYFWQNF